MVWRVGGVQGSAVCTYAAAAASEACPSGGVLRLGGHEAAACVVLGLPCGARRLRYRAIEINADEMKTRGSASRIMSTRAIHKPPTPYKTRSPIKNTDRSPRNRTRLER